MYRILFTRGVKAYAIECDVEFKLPSDWHDNLFDENLHEAIARIPAQNEDEKGKVIDETTKGYYLNDKVIRYSKVVVAM